MSGSSAPASSLPVVEFLDLAALHAPLRDAFDKIWFETMRDSSFISGPAVAQFENEWAAYCGTDIAIGVANGTDAIELVLAGLDIGPGDEVIVPANTFVATAEAVVTVGATPVFVDVDEDTLLISAAHIEAALTPRTRAVLVVHLYGQVPEMGPILELCDRNGVAVLEDSAQAHGATHNGTRAGNFGRAATFSFYPGKNLGALGDGGAVVTSDADLAEAIRVNANHGRGNHLSHVMSGRNSRLDGLQGAALSIKLAHIDAWNERRRQVHARYVDLFAGSSVTMLATVPGSEPVHHLEVIRVADRDRVREHLSGLNIKTGIHYAMACHHQPAFEQYAPASPLVVAETACATQLSIPMHPTLTDEEVERVAASVLEAVADD